MICPFCKFERIGEYDNPDWECPNCLKAYSKYKAKVDSEKPKINMVKEWTIVLFGIAFCLWGIIDFVINGTVEFCATGGCTSITFDKSPIGFIFVTWVHLIIGFGAIKYAFKLTASK